MHSGCEQARGDDLESLAYTLVYLREGILPWQCLQASTLEESLELAAECKAATSPEALCKGLPEAFAQFTAYSRDLRFGGTPNYTLWRDWFKEIFFKQGFQEDGIFDWTLRGYSQSESL